VGTLLEDYAKSIDSLIDKAEKLEEKALTDESLSDAARLKQLSDAAALREEAQAVAADWGPTGTYRQVTTAMLAAASGNVAGGVGQFGRDLVINYAQQNGAQLIGDLVARGELSEGSPLHAALHGLVACAAASASDQQCGAGAAGAAASTLLASLFADPAPDEKASDVESRRNLLVSLVAGIATASDAAPSTATSAATAATDNNWLASRQIAQMEKERKEAKTLLEEAAVIAKWSGVSLKQDALTVNGIGKGLVEAGWSDIEGIAGSLLNLRENVTGLQQLLNQEDVLNLIGEAVAKDVKAKLDTIEVALRDGGDHNAELLGKTIGSVLWQVAGLVTGAGGVKSGVDKSVELARLGIKFVRNKTDSIPNGAGSKASVAGEHGIDRNGNRTVMDQNMVSGIGDVACGPTCGAMILADKGTPKNIIHLAQDANIGKYGTTIENLTTSLEKHGLEASYKLDATVDDLAMATAKGNPAIVMVALDGDLLHYVVIDGVTTRQGVRVVAIRDPDKGQQYFMPVDKFNDRFVGQAIFTTGK